MLGAPTERLTAYLAGVIAIFIAAADFLLRSSWIDGNFLNSYPFMSPDSYDWMFQGAALWLHVSGIDQQPWPFLRNPLFVLFAALDYGLNWNGRLILLVESAGVGATIWAVASIARSFNKRVSLTLVGLAAMLGMPLWALNFTILSDQLCVGLMMLSLERLIASERDRSRSYLFAAAVFAILSGLTQTYGIIAFGTMALSFAAIDLIKRKELRLDLLLAGAFVAISTTLIIHGWRLVVPHREGFIQFRSLALSFDMLPFYLNVWTVSFLTFLPAAFLGLSARRDREQISRSTLLALTITIIAFMMLTLFYQYRESRYTLFYVPLVITILILALPDAPPQRTIAIATLLGGAVFNALVSWGDIWGPQIKGISLAPARTWVGMIIRARPQDRFNLKERCGERTTICSERLFDADPEPYRRGVLQEFARRTLKASAARTQGVSEHLR